ncbi:hypothetical protein BMR11_03575 [Methylococcaceae bacterium CS5]|uniref:hypothetical protein n=1 Tax=Bathymodiolus platifrons methanotrophic gill symbiont TaxID=113268 RepID=UPI0011E6F78A|nr:hypothetical protein [Bathymodiolus platifrons methanotrophic gill symbiont]TXL00422.1 hypothetical protein BMR11_03575 [Methylococcaceae bacterium CS5]
MIKSLPDDASYDEIMQELAFQRMVESGLEDSRQGKVINKRKWGLSMTHKISLDNQYCGIERPDPLIFRWFFLTSVISVSQTMDFSP